MSKVKYVDTAVTFSEIPDEISLCINISNCPHRCGNCHSPYLQEDIGEELTPEILDKLIEDNKGITCVCFMGEGERLLDIAYLSELVHSKHNLKTAWYTGLDCNLSNHLIYEPLFQDFDYVQTGPYIESLGPLNKKTTNQRMYKRISEHPIKFEDITNRFWKN